jgi:hypothetical protein
LAGVALLLPPFDRWLLDLAALPIVAPLARVAREAAPHRPPAIETTLCDCSIDQHVQLGATRPRAGLRPVTF